MLNFYYILNFLTFSSILQVDYQHLDFDTGASTGGLNFGYSKNDISLGIIAGQIEPRKSTTFLGDYNPRIPNYSLKQDIYGSDFNLSSSGLTMGFSLLFIDQPDNDISNRIGGMRFEKSYNKGELFLSFIHKMS